MGKRKIRFELLVSVFAILLALIVSDILILIYGESPLHVYRLLIEGTLLNPYGLGQVLFKMTPLIFTGLAVAFAFRAGMFNIGGEGQLYAGAFVTALIGFSLPASLPLLIVVPLCLLGGFLAGALAGFIPGWLKAKLGAHEVINTIMLNFIIVALVGYFAKLVNVAETLHTPEIIAGAKLPRLFAYVESFRGSAANVSFFIALLAAFLVWVLLFKTKYGYELRAVGLNPTAAENAGINVKRHLMLAMAIAGGLAGLVGLNFVLGYKYYFEEMFSSGLGFMGIAVALLGQNHPFGIVLAALFFGILSQGGLVINAVVPKELVDILQAVVILCVVASSSEVRRLLFRAGR